MPHHQETKFLPFTPAQIFDLVVDVAKYPEFLPWCAAAHVHEQGEGYLRADLAIGYKIFQEKFTSQVSFTRPECLQVTYEDGPFKYLQNDWGFRPHQEGGVAGCRVDFMVDFEFRSFLLEKAMQPVFTKAVFKMIQSFEARAHQLYTRD